MIFESFVDGMESRIDAFVADVHRRGGPAASLDRSIESLEVLWPWFVAAVLVSRSGPRAVGRSSESQAAPNANLAWWIRFQPERARILGDELVVASTGLADYFCACIVRNAPGSTWEISRRAGTFHQPVLVIPGRGDLNPENVIGLASAIASGVETTHSAPNGLRRIAEAWLGLDPEHERLLAAIARPMPRYTVRRIDDPRWSHEVALGDALAHAGSGRIQAMVRALRAEQGVSEVIWEDREIVLVRAPEIPLERVVALATDALGPPGEESPDASHGSPRADVS